MSLNALLEKIKEASMRHVATSTEPIATQEIFPLLVDLVTELAQEETGEEPEDLSKQPVTLELPFILVSGVKEVLEYFAAHLGTALTFQAAQLLQGWGMDPNGAHKAQYEQLLQVFGNLVATPALFANYASLVGYLTGKDSAEIMAQLQGQEEQQIN